MINWKQQFRSMKIRFTEEFSYKLDRQIDFIANDKPAAARKFKKEILKRIREIPKMPFRFRQSIFFDSKEIRDLIFMGYIVVFKINEKENSIDVFGFSKWENDPFEKD